MTLSPSPTIDELQTEIRRLTAENNLLKQMQQASNITPAQVWQQRINDQDCTLELIEQLLGEVAGQTQVSTANFMIYNQGELRLDMAAHYPSLGVNTFKQTFFTDVGYPYFSERLLAGKNVVIDDIASHPMGSQNKLGFEKLKQKSVLCIPVLYKGKLQAVLNLHDGMNIKVWEEENIDLATQAAVIINQAYQRHLNRTFQNWYEKAETLLVRSSSFESVEHCFYELCQLIDIDEINFHVPVIGQDQLFESVCRYPSNAETEPSEYRADISTIPWVHEQLKTKRIVRADDINDLPPEADNDKRTFQAVNKRSELIVSLANKEFVLGSLELSTKNRRHVWSNREVQYVKKILPLIHNTHQKIYFQKTRQETLEILRMVLEVTNVGYCIFNRDLTDYYYSPFASTMLGFPDGTQVTPQWTIDYMFWSKEERLNDAHLRQSVFETKQPVSGVLKLKSKDQKPLWAQCTYSPLSFDNNGNLSTILVGFSDISEVFKKQEVAEQLRIEADNANQSKGEFLARMSHEIRTPMNAILGMGYLLQDTELNEKQSEQVAHINQAAKNLLGIINDILDFSKIESGKMTLESTEFELSSLLEQVTQVASYHRRHKEQELILQVDKHTPNQLYGDPLRLRQILTNLLSNAVKFTAKGNIFLKVHQTPTGIAFSVRDQGIGMSEQQIKNLFLPFTQADGSISREYGGTGLGLSIVKNLVELMGGQINVASQPGKGSEFSFMLPLKAVENAPSDQLRITSLKTLVVDDNEQARAVIVSMAEQLGLEVHSAENAKQAFELLETNNDNERQCFEVVLMDYRMPEIDGLNAANSIKHNKRIKHVPTIIMVSAYDRDDVMKNELSKHIEGFLSKPVSPSRLYNSINSLIHKNQEKSRATILNNENLTGVQVLLVEDNIVNQKVAKGVLNKQGVEVTVANNGQEAIDTMMERGEDFQLILMDIEMPQVDGYQATRFIRNQLKSDIPIIAMTAHAMESTKLLCIEAGMNDHVHKPIAPKVLYNTMRKFLPTNAT